MLERSPALIRVGPAGWSYRDWEGIVYPRRKPAGFDPLEYLSRYFDVVEINSTFYRPMPAAVAERWAERVSRHPTFRFTLKLWRRFTHERDSRPSREEIRQARQAPDVLHARGRLGAVLLQFPWSFRNTEENRAWLDATLSELAGFPAVVEVRHASWVEEGVLQELRERGVGFVNVDQPLFHDSVKPGARATGEVAYIRVHGRNYREWFRRDAGRDARYDYLYSADELRPWAERARELARLPGTRAVYVVTNNHTRGKAPANALMLASMLSERPVWSPPELYATYRATLAPFARPVTETRHAPVLDSGGSSKPLP